MSSDGRRPAALIGGSVLIAAISSACCWLPLLAVGLGFSAVGFGTSLERYRLVFLAMASGFLAGAVALQRRKRRACEGDSCPPLRGLDLLMPIAGGMAVLGLAVVPEIIAWTQPHEELLEGVAEEELVVIYVVNGMTCEGCTSLLVSHLEDQPEIRDASVDYASGTARVGFTPDTLDPDMVMQRATEDWKGKYTFHLRLDR